MRNSGDATTLRTGPRDYRRSPDAVDAHPEESSGLEALARSHGALWPELGPVTWQEIAGAVGAPTVRVAQYRLSLHGWKFRSVSSNHHGSRVVIQAPCDGCGQPHPPVDLKAHCCVQCRALCGEP